MKKLLALIIILIFFIPQIFSEYTQEQKLFEQKILNFWDNTCENIKERKIPIIFIPWILASWYSEEWFKESWKIKRWIPDPITHVYDTIFYTFLQNKYELKDVFYIDELNLKILKLESQANKKEEDQKAPFYLFWYDWKKDNKVTAALLTQLISKILKEYEEQNWCNIWKVNIIAHSMWWLVARAMLEDMCAEYKYENDKFEIIWYDNKKTKNWLLPNYKTSECRNIYTWETIKVNKLITISTPHRWSPKSLPMWEKWDLNMVETDTKAMILRTQLDVDDNDELYKLFHWYNKKVPNWVVTVGQLLPDIKNKNTYNTNLNYMFKLDSFSKEKTYMDNENHPRNSFLEELNKQENINKMFNKIEKKFISYYSKVTWNLDKNNIIQYELTSKYGDLDWEKYTVQEDETNQIIWKDIYDYYDKSKAKSYYNIFKSIRNDIWLWWDWTVPTYNLLLVPNDSNLWKQIDWKVEKHNFYTNWSKTFNLFEAREIKCYKNSNLTKNWYTEENTAEIYKKIWRNVKFEICSHSNMPIATSLEIVKELTLEDVRVLSNKLNEEDDDLVNNKNLTQERRYLWSYIWYTEFTDYYWNEDWWIRNDSLMQRYLEEGNYIHAKVEWHAGIFDTRKFLSLDFTRSPFTIPIDQIDRIIKYEILSPINIVIEDNQWRKIWIDPDTWKIKNEIPWAWTSWDTEGSWEPEFFLIPVTGTWEIKHKIKTYWTWDGEYHIVMSQINKDITKKIEKIVIAGIAKENYWEDYNVNIEPWKTATFENLTDDTITKLEIENEKYKAKNNKLQLKYTIRWNHKQVDVDKVYYKIIKNNKVISWSINKITWVLNIKFEKPWKYEMQIWLLDKNWKKLKNNWKLEAPKVIEIDNNEIFEKKYFKKFEKIKKIIEEKINNKQRLKLKKYIIIKKEKYLEKILEEYKNDKYRFFLDKIEGML